MTPEDVHECLEVHECIELLLAEDLIEENVSIKGHAFIEELESNAFPMPRVFIHGPKSVVFTWTNGNRNVYVTVSVGNIGLMTSVPERIELRRGYSPEALKVALSRESSIIIPKSRMG